MSDPQWQAGPELDAEVAGIVLGLEPCSVPGCVREGRYHALRSYSADLAAAWLVVERLISSGHDYLLLWGDTEGWRAGFIPHDSSIRARYMVGPEPTAPLAICRAALLFLEKRPSGTGGRN